MRITTTAACLLTLLGWAPTTAQAEPTADPTKVVIPDLTFQPTPRDIGRFDDYFYFHKIGVSAQSALRDINECGSFSSNLNPMSRIPQFIPLNGELPEASTSSASTPGLGMGLVGTAILAIATADLQSSDERGNFRRCMGYKGYQRYGTSKQIWSKITSGSDQEATLRMALIAAGPQPQGSALEP